MIIKKALTLLVVVALQQFTNAVPLDNPGKQLEHNDLEQRPAEPCGDRSLRCQFAGIPPTCRGRVFYCLLSDVAEAPMGSCTLCGGFYVPERFWEGFP